MKSPIEIIDAVRRLCQHNNIPTDDIKITVEFLSPEVAHKAEFAFRTKAQGISVPPQLVDSVCSQREFSVMGFKMQVKVKVADKYYLPICNCAWCSDLCAQRQ